MHDEVDNKLVNLVHTSTTQHGSVHGYNQGELIEYLACGLLHTHDLMSSTEYPTTNWSTGIKYHLAAR